MYTYVSNNLEKNPSEIPRAKSNNLKSFAISKIVDTPNYAGNVSKHFMHTSACVFRFPLPRA